MSQMYYVGPMEAWAKCLVPSIAGLAPLICFRACPFAHLPPDVTGMCAVGGGVRGVAAGTGLLRLVLGGAAIPHPHTRWVQPWAAYMSTGFCRASREAHWANWQRHGVGRRTDRLPECV